MGAQGPAAGEQVAVTVGQGHTRVEQGVPDGFHARGGGVGGDRRGGVEPVPGVLEGVGRQVDVDGSGRVEHAGPVHPHSGDVCLGEGPEQPGFAGVAAPQRPDRRDVAAVVLRGPLHTGGEHRVRADLDEVAEPRVEQGAHGVLEADLGAEVAVPVRGVQRGRVGPLGGHGGVERHVGGAWRETRRRLLDLGSDLLHVDRVGGVVDRNAAGTHAVGVVRGEQSVERGGVAGDHEVGGAVDRGDGQGAVVGGNGAAHVARGCGDRGHAAAAGECRQRPAAQCHHARPVLQAQRARHDRGGDLALRVAHDRGRPDAVGLPHRGQRHHDRPQRGLDDLHPLQRRLVAQRS
ncbi:hypothetical protein EES44_18350 [Streptomyces sp. ADI96-15]|nr:hypothetical protein EES44_18350 [Streptomyces sp. ADI96-15]